VRHTTTLRVRYADTDKMGIVYYAKYPEYFEVARTEMLRAFGLPYREIEAAGCELPVASAAIRYYKGAKYDDEITVTAEFTPANSPRVEIRYEVRDTVSNELLAEGETTLVFVSSSTGRPAKPPEIWRKVVGSE
jgi:acyl-CoA thioester hydrolase